MATDARQLRPLHVVTLGVILAIAALVRFHNLDAQPLSIDELGTMEVASGRGQLHLTLPRDVVISPAPPVTTLDFAPPVWSVPFHMESDVHPPLYFLALRIWQDIFGNGDFSSRALSAVAGILGVLVLFDVGRWLVDIQTGLCAALLMAIAEPEIISARDARPYALLTLLVLCAADALLRIEKLGVTRARTIGLAAALTCGLLTHYFVLPAIVSLGIYAVPRLPARGRKSVYGALIFAVAAAGVLWGYGLWVQSQHFGAAWMYWFNESVSHHVRATFARAAELPIRYLADPPSGTALASLGAVLYVLPWLLVRKRPALLLPALLLVTTPAMLVALDLYRGTIQIAWIKYTLLAGPAVYLLIPMVFAAPWPRLGITAAAALYCALALISAPQNKVDQIHIAADLGRLARPDEPVLFAGEGWGDWYTGTLYMYMERYSARLPDSVVLLKSPSPGLLAQLRRYPRVWLVTGWTSQAPEVLLPGCRAVMRCRYPYAAMVSELSWVGASDNPR